MAGFHACFVKLQIVFPLNSNLSTSLICLTFGGQNDIIIKQNLIPADVTELADVQASDTCGYYFLVGSSPIVRTKKEVTFVY